MDQKALKSYLAYLLNSQGEAVLSNVELDFVNDRISYVHYINDFYGQYAEGEFRFKKRPDKSKV